MNTASSTTTLQTHCIQIRSGLIYLAILAFVGAVLSGVIGGVLLSEDLSTIGWPLLLLTLPLLVAAVPLYRRGQFPVDVALTPAGLQLSPQGHALKLGVTAETLPLAGISGYSVMEHTSGQQLKLFLADGRELTLSDRPRSILKAPDADFVLLTELSAALQQRLSASGSPAQARPNFFQGLGGQVLAGFCALCVVAAVGLLFVPGVEWTQSLRLLTFALIYLGVYWRNRRPRPQ